jgi:hypothetical protein
MEKHNTMAIASRPSPTATTIVTFRELIRMLTGSSADSEELPVNPTSKLFLKAFFHGGLTGPRRSPYTNQGTAGMRNLEPDTPVQTPPSSREPDPKKKKNPAISWKCPKAGGIQRYKKGIGNPKTEIIRRNRKP